MRYLTKIAGTKSKHFILWLDVNKMKKKLLKFSCYRFVAEKMMMEKKIC
jgi:hypothetical protein